MSFVAMLNRILYEAQALACCSIEFSVMNLDDVFR